MPVITQFQSSWIDAASRYLKPKASTVLLAWSAGVSLTLLLGDIPSIRALLAIALVLVVLSMRFIHLWVISAFILGFTWACWSFSQFGERSLPPELEGVNLTVVGLISNLPDVNSQRSRFRFTIESFIDDNRALFRDQEFHDLTFQSRELQLSCYRCPFQFEPQQRWRLTVRLKRPHAYASWGAFDYEKFLFRHQVLATGYVRLKSENSFLDQSDISVNQMRWQLAQALQNQMQHSDVAYGILSALTVGYKTAISAEHKQVFQSTGISHLMAISGLHIGLIFAVSAYLFGGLLNFISRVYYWRPRQQLVLLPSLLVAFAYAALAGFAVSTQRALVMLCIYALCRLFARELSLLKVLLLAASLILLFDPFSVLDAGFWLSCGAVMVIALANEGDKPLTLLRLQPIIWLGMMPLTGQIFGQISLISPFINLLMVPLFCLLLIPLVFVAAILLMVGESYFSGHLLSGLGWCLEWIYHTLSWISQLSIANWYLPELDYVDGLLTIFLLLAYAMRSQIGFKLHWILLIPFLIGLGFSATHVSEGEVEVTMLDVGQGLSMVIQTKNNVTVYDAGPAYASGFSASKAVLLPYLRSRGIKRIDTLIISHADNDHIGDYIALLDAYPVVRQLSSRPDKVPGAELCSAGQNWLVDGISFEILSPDTSTPTGSNNLSCILLISNGRTSVMIAGDIEKNVEANLLANNENLQADILLIPHHGSKTSSTVEFIDSVAPKLGLISAGYRNRYGHPHADVVKRYEQREVELASTIWGGSLRIKIDQQGWRKEAFREVRRRFWRH